MDVILKSGAVALIDDQPALPVGSYEWDQMSTGHVYAMTKDPDGRPHVLLLERLVAPAPVGFLVEHRNGNRLDNRRDNLVHVEYRPYRRRRKGANNNSASGIRGVQYAPKMSPATPWRAQIYAKGHSYHLGMYATTEEAIAMRQAAELCVFGEVCQ